MMMFYTLDGDLLNSALLVLGGGPRLCYRTMLSNGPQINQPFFGSCMGSEETFSNINDRL